VDTVRWVPWSSDAFALARAESRPVLLSIVTAWSESCLEMDRTSYADRSVVDALNDRFVPIRVDADRRPDISERYTLGGWPTTAFLDADGRIVGGGTYISVERMPAVLARVLDAFASRRDEIRSRGDELAHAPAGVVAGSSRESVSAAGDLAAVVFETFDAEYGGFGVAPKFPLTPPLALALETFRSQGDRAMAAIVERTLDAMGWGGLYDEVDGGFYRCAMERDWQAPRREKLLEVNASLLAIYAEASAALDVARYRERAGDVLRYVQTWLADQVDGGWYGSQPARVDERGSIDEVPAADGVLYTAANARMASAALRAAELLDDTALGEFAVKSLERVVLACYRPGQGIAHYSEPQPTVRGLLDDQIAIAAAMLDAHTATGNIVYEMMAQELAHYAVRVMWDDERGGFFDRSVPEPTDDVGLMRTRLKPFAGNCEAARVLKRLASVKGAHDFGARADATLAALAPRAAEQGPLAADYLLALRS
jgi:uncharacterized protein YyaL (SSP411 family)